MQKALAFFFDAGSGVCLWSKNDAARGAFGYAIDHHALPLDAATRAELDRLIQWHDCSLDMDDPGRGSIWPAQEQARFDAAAQGALNSLRKQLAPPGWEIADQRPAGRA